MLIMECQLRDKRQIMFPFHNYFPEYNWYSFIIIIAKCSKNILLDVEQIKEYKEIRSLGKLYDFLIQHYCIRKNMV